MIGIIKIKRKIKAIYNGKSQFPLAPQNIYKKKFFFLYFMDFIKNGEREREKTNQIKNQREREKL